jgi:hypothetical protein
MNAIVQTSAAGLYNERLAIVLGFITLLLALAVLASCRVVPIVMNILHKDPMQSHFYQTFYKWHAYLWWVFGTMLLLHLSTAFIHTGFPVPGDPDAPIHWVILGAALGSLLFFFIVLASCRSIVTFINVLAGKNPLQNRFFKWFYARHGLYWWLFALIFLVHISAAGIHTGVWPR